MFANNSYSFNEMGRMGADPADNSQRTVQNTRFANYTVASFQPSNTSDEQVKFSSEIPTMIVSTTGVSSSVIDTNSFLLLDVEQRAVDKLSLQQRPFLTIPFLGRGNVDPDTETALLVGENANMKRSEQTIMDKSFMPYSQLILDQNQVNDPAGTIQELSMDGWYRGGMNTRNTDAPAKQA
jgi:hypothetical protein